MKKGDKFQIDSHWWDQERPKLLPSTGLGAAFKAYATAKRQFQAALTPVTHKEAIAALDGVEHARAKAVKLCGPAFKVEKAIFVAGEQVVVQEKHKLDELGRAGAKVKAQAVVREIDGYLEEMRAMEITCARAENFLIEVGDKDHLDDGEKAKLEKALNAAANIIYDIEARRTMLLNIDKRPNYTDAVYFKAEPDVVRARSAGRNHSTGRDVTDNLRDLVTTVASKHGIHVKIKSHQ